MASASRVASEALSIARAAVVGVAAGRNSEKAAIDFLNSQHREVESLFKQFGRAENDNERFEVAQVICQKLTVHASIEEELVYPLARRGGKSGELKDIVLESLEEHRSVKRLIADIQSVEVGDETLKAKISVLNEQVSHHVDEEEDDLFPQLKKEMSEDEQSSLGQQLMARADELEAAVDAGTDRSAAADFEEDTELETDEKSHMPNGAMSVGAERGQGTSRHERSTDHHH